MAKTVVATYGLYTYGLAGKSPERLDILGIDKQHTVFPVEGRDICVMVSNIDIDQFQNQVKVLFSELTTATGAAQSGTGVLLQAHEDVVEALMQDTTIVPFKFGTILKDEKAAARMLLDDEEQFKKLLLKFTGRAEWGLKVYADTQEFMRHAAQTDPRFKHLEEQRARLSRGAAYLLGKKVEEELKDHAAARLAEITAVLFQELSKDAYEAKLNKTIPQQWTDNKKEMILNAAYLVEREMQAPFCSQGQRLRERCAGLGLDLEVSGPWPPYSFT